MVGFIRDLKYAIRLLFHSPTFTLVAVLTLGLGIGAVTAIFSVVNAVILKPLPFPRSDELVQFYTQFPAMKFDKFWMSPPVPATRRFQRRRLARALRPAT
jgi:putative ABC transport system permease protein